MKKLVAFILLVTNLVCPQSWAQKEDYNWILGGSGGGPDSSPYRTCRLEFSVDSFNAIFINKNNSFDVFNATISSATGQFQAFSKGNVIYNREMEVMENGDSLAPHYFNTDGISYQMFFLLPKPGDSTKVVHINGDRQLLGTAPFGSKIADIGVLYAEIDMTANNGLGKVVLRDQQVGTDTVSSFGYSACRHGNGRDWWILAPNSHDTTVYYRYLLDPTGLHRIGSQKINSTYRGIGSSFFSPDGKWLARFMEWGFSTPYKSTMNLYQFDRCTGLLSDRIVQNLPGGNKPGGVAFSDDSRFLYVSVWDTIYQFDVTAPDILATREVVAVYDGFTDSTGKKTTFFSMLLAPDKRIYICTANSNTRYLHVIAHPEKKGVACEVQQHHVFLPAYNSFCIPNMPYYRLYDWKDSPCDTIGMVATKEPGELLGRFSIAPNPATNQFQVFFGEPLLSNAKLSIIDLNGRVMQRIPIPKGLSGMEVSADGLQEGCYFVQLLGEDGWIEVRKLIIVE